MSPRRFVTPEIQAGTNGSGVIASGWQTLGLMMRLFATGFLDTSNLGSPGMDEVRWLRPVRPGDRLDVKVTIAEARPSASKPDRGIVRSKIEMTNQDGEPVVTLTVLNLILRRPTQREAGV